MYDRLRKRLEGGRQDGFTLIELLIVIVILGILAAIVVFAVGGITDKGQEAACDADRKTLQTAQEAYFAQPVSAGGGNGTYATEAELVPKFLAEESTLYNTAPKAGTDEKEYAITVQAPASGSAKCTLIGAA